MIKTRTRYYVWFWAYNGKPLTKDNTQLEEDSSEPENKYFDSLEEAKKFRKTLYGHSGLRSFEEEYIYDSDYDIHSWELVENSEKIIEN